MGFSSATYWETRYRAGGTSGAGSTGHLAAWKAAVLNGFFAANRVASVIDVGCGDASQLALLRPPDAYIGVDVSPTALARCAAAHPGRRFMSPDALRREPPAEMTICLDVLYHLIEESVFDSTLRMVFDRAARFVAIYASNVDAAWPAAHVRHRCFTDRVRETQPDWRLLAHLPNPWPFDPARPEGTSFADFFFYARAGLGGVIPVPAA